MLLCKWHTFWMAPWLICCFTFLLHIEWKWLLQRNLVTILPLTSKLSAEFQSFNAIDGDIEMLKVVEFPKTSFKMKNLEHFTSPKQRSARRKLLSPPSDKSFLRLWDKSFRTEIYSNIQIFAFQVLRECSYWTSKGFQ